MEMFGGRKGKIMSKNKIHFLKAMCGSMHVPVVQALSQVEAEDC